MTGKHWTLLIVVLILGMSELVAQVQDSSALRDTIQLPLQDSLRSTDSIPQTTSYRISKDAIEERVEYGAIDSQIMDNRKKLVHLHGDAYVNYGTLSLKADYIQLDLNTNIAIAEGAPDSTGKMAGFPVFKDGAQEITAKRMKYNFKTLKGLVYENQTTQGDLYVHGTTTKFYGAGGPENRPHHVIFNRDAIFTTCDHDIPHFGIRSRKQKVVPDKVAVVGTSNLEIGGVPTPLVLPFGFFPLKLGKRGGLMFPNNYQYSERWGYGLQNVGYFFPISDHVDFTLLTDIYLRGSYAVNGEMRYKKRYKYNGNLRLGYSSFREETVATVDEEGNQELRVRKDNSYFISLSHNQAATAHPNRTIGGSLNIEGGQFQRLNYNDASNVLRNSLSSNLYINQSFPGSPFTASLSVRHSQNTNTREVSMSLPQFSLRMKQINPFKRKRRLGDEKWYEKVTLTYSSNLRYDLNGADSSFFEQETFDNAKFGVEHNLGTSVNFNVFKYFTLSPFVNFNETWYTKATRRTFNQELEIVERIEVNPNDVTDTMIVLDTLSFGDIESNRINQFNAIHEYDAGVSLVTRFYGTLRFKKGRLRGIRHTVKPSISMSYSPDYTRPELEYFDEVISIGNDGLLDTTRYSIFESENFGSPTGTERFALNYSITNLFEAKLFNKKDSSFRKANILDNLNISGSYNFAADSLNWSFINVSGNMRLLKGLAQVKIQASFDPYAINEEGTRINTFEFDKSGNILRFRSAAFSLNARRSFKDIRNLFASKSNEKSKSKTESESALASFFDKLTLSYQFTLRSKFRDDNSVFFEPSIHSVAIQGDLPLSPKWSIVIGNLDYNFIRKATSYPDLYLTRDLHCWTMGIGWQPERSTYNFFIRVKPGSLDFINVPYTRNRVDGF